MIEIINRKILKLFILIIFIFVLEDGYIIGNVIKNEINLFPIKQKIMHGHEADIDPERGDALLLENIQTSNYIKDNTGIDYSINSALGGMWNTAWCMNGDGKGEWFKADIPPNQLLYKGMMNVYRLTIVNGLAANEKLYFANNRVKKIEVEFSEGEKRILNLNDGNLKIQIFKINIKARWLKMTIREIYKGNKYNDTCIGKLFFDTDIHPDDMTLEERKSRGYK